MKKQVTEINLQFMLQRVLSARRSRCDTVSVGYTQILFYRSGALVRIGHSHAY